MEKVTHKQARRRYMRAFWPVMTFYMIAIIGGALWRNQYETPPLWLGAAIAIAVSIPLIVILFLLVRYFSETDEYTRLMHLTAFAYGGCITIGAVFVVGFLQMFDVIRYVDVFWFGPGFFLAYGLAYRFMGGEDCV